MIIVKHPDQDIKKFPPLYYTPAPEALTHGECLYWEVLCLNTDGLNEYLRDVSESFRTRNGQEISREELMRLFIKSYPRHSKIYCDYLNIGEWIKEGYSISVISKVLEYYTPARVRFLWRRDYIMLGHTNSGVVKTPSADEAESLMKAWAFPEDIAEWTRCGYSKEEIAFVLKNVLR